MKKVSLNKRWKEVLFAATGFGPNLLMVLMMAYFTDAVIPTGLKADIGFWSYGGTIIVSTIIFPILWTIGRVFDGIVDVPLAAFTDNLKNKTGKRWVAILIAVAPMVISFILCWIPIFGKSGDLSLGQQIGNSIWIFFWSIIFFASYTLALITFYGALSDVCEDQTQRARVSAYKSVFDTISYALVYAAIPAIFKAIGLPIWQVALYGTPLMVTILFPIFMQKKVPAGETVTFNEEKAVPIGVSIKLTLESKPFMKWTLVNCVAFFGLQMFLVAQNTLISGVMNLGAGWAAVLNTCAFAPVPLMLYLFNRLRKKVGVRPVFQSALLSFGICIFSFCLGSQWFWGDQLMPKLIIGAIGGIIGSWGIGAFFMMPYLIPTSIASVEEEVTGKNHSAMYFAIQALATSIVGAIASSLVYNYLKLWQTPTGETMYDEILGKNVDVFWKNGVSMVPFIVFVACILGFFFCFLMPKNYTARTTYLDIKESAERRLPKLEKKRAVYMLKVKEGEIAAEHLEEESAKELALKSLDGVRAKIVKIEKDIAETKAIIDYKFDEAHSIGNEEDRVLEKNSTFANVALWVLSGGIFGLVSVLLDFKKFKIAGVKLSAGVKAIAIIACFVPSLGILADYKFKKAFEELEKQHELDLGSKRFVPSMIIFACIPVPFMMNVYSLAIRTNMFNKISDKLQAKGN
ncbi:MAG: MFS transporter [Bacilli bacterium]|nr:MFS transporter [Bacilli bacterium]